MHLKLVSHLFSSKFKVENMILILNSKFNSSWQNVLHYNGVDLDDRLIGADNIWTLIHV